MSNDGTTYCAEEICARSLPRLFSRFQRDKETSLGQIFASLSPKVSEKEWNSAMGFHRTLAQHVEAESNVAGMQNANLDVKNASFSQVRE